MRRSCWDETRSCLRKNTLATITLNMAKANKETQDQFFGSPARADLFRREVERGADPQETLARMLRGPRDDKKWRRVSEGLRAKPKR